MDDIVKEVLNHMRCSSMKECIHIPALNLAIRYDRNVFHVENSVSKWIFTSLCAVSYVCLSCLDNLVFTIPGQSVTIFLQHRAMDGFYSLPVLNVVRYADSGPWLLSSGEPFVHRFQSLLHDFVHGNMRFDFAPPLHV